MRTLMRVRSTSGRGMLTALAALLRMRALLCLRTLTPRKRRKLTPIPSTLLSRVAVGYVAVSRVAVGCAAGPCNAAVCPGCVAGLRTGWPDDRAPYDVTVAHLVDPVRPRKYLYKPWRLPFHFWADH